MEPFRPVCLSVRPFCLCLSCWFNLPLQFRKRKRVGLEVEARSAFSEDSPEDTCQSCLHSGSGGAARWCGSMDDGRLDQMIK